jgi:queuine tRNA-ribosyltransferase
MVSTPIQLRNHLLVPPVFLPDATQGVVRSLDATDLLACHVDAVVMNTFHLMQHPGSTAIHALGGLHNMTGWTGPIVTDSGGFQAYSLIHQNPKMGSIQDNGIIYLPEAKTRKIQLTPEKSIQLQFAYGSDVIICLDDCTHVDAPFSEQDMSVRRTINWARRGKAEYLRQLSNRRIEEGDRPLLFAVIQGGGFPSLRKVCAEALLEIGFDGYGYGGWPLDGKGNLLEEIITYTRQLVPLRYPMHALGIGHPVNVLACYQFGYSLFDSAMPTRDARHGRLYTLRTQKGQREFKSTNSLIGDWMDYVYIGDEKFIRDGKPLSEDCDCLSCQRYSRGFLHHLFKINDTLYFRLATLHNLRFMTRLTDCLRDCSQNDPTTINLENKNETTHTT